MFFLPKLLLPTFCSREPEELSAIQLHGIVPATGSGLEIAIGKHRALLQLHVQLPARPLDLNADDPLDVQFGARVPGHNNHEENNQNNSRRKTTKKDLKCSLELVYLDDNKNNDNQNNNKQFLMCSLELVYTRHRSMGNPPPH